MDWPCHYLLYIFKILISPTSITALSSSPFILWNFKIHWRPLKGYEKGIQGKGEKSIVWNVSSQIQERETEEEKKALKQDIWWMKTVV